jgi:hypothetical protein
LQARNGLAYRSKVSTAKNFIDFSESRFFSLKNHSSLFSSFFLHVKLFAFVMMKEFFGAPSFSQRDILQNTNTLILKSPLTLGSPSLAPSRHD